MISNFYRALRPVIYFLVGFCGALAIAIASFFAPNIAPVQSAPVIQPQAQPPISEFALETAASHRAPNFYQ